MSLFQNSVIQKHLRSIDRNSIASAFSKYSAYFHNPAIRQNILEAKEEQFQEGFLRELFVKILGYTLYPEPNYNLTTEYKNIKDSKKADGVIIINDTVKAVIELKGTNTIDLGKIENQAFGYKNNQPDCVYVITSNFEKLRLYIDNAIEYIEFNLFTLTAKEFDLLYLCLAFDNICKNLPKTIKDESLSQEDAITKKLYQEYSRFKRELHQDLVSLNPQFDALILFKKSQKLLDRFLFLLFAEDRLLLPPNSVRMVLNDWRDLQEREVEIPLYDRFKKYFGYLNTGYKGKRYDVFAYNGGLFQPDEILDIVKIEDELLFNHILKLSEYDYASEVDVNILGHIFENSLNELDEIKAQLEGKEIDKSKTKRKKEGVFYTPKFITKYIVDNTVGKLCNEKKAELGLHDEDYTTDKKRQKKVVQELVEKLTVYRNWLLQITICDPACGSGAFLNQALDFLIHEHRYIDELQAKLFGDAMVLSDIENSILENNLYGVDLNEESVEIARLSLWLRTAQPNRRLNNLNNNIKCGNSLIDDPDFADEKAFNWFNEFPKVFPYYRNKKEGTISEPPEPGDRTFVDEMQEPAFSYKANSKGFVKHGFDVIIGNPPYVRQELLGDFKPYFEKHYSVYDGTSDLFAYFYEQSFRLLKHDGLFSFITNTFDKTRAAKKLRSYLKNNTTLITVVDFTEVQIFEGATTYPIILIARKKLPRSSHIRYIKIPKESQPESIDINLMGSKEVSQDSLKSEAWNFNSITDKKILDKITEYKTIREVFGKCYRGVVTGFNDAFIIGQKTKDFLEKEHPSSKELIKPFYEGKDIRKWHTPLISKYLIFTKRGTNISDYPAIQRYLEVHKENLTPKSSPDQIKGRKPGSYKWFEIQDSVDYYKIFESPKIIWPNLQAANKFCFDTHNYYINAPCVVFPSSSKTLLCILNSRVVWEFLKSICVVRNGGYLEIKPQYFEQIPIPKLRNEDTFERLASSIISYTDEFQQNQTRFINFLQNKFSIEKPGAKLQNWDELDFNEFMKELIKAKVRLSLSEEAEWMQYFSEQKLKAEALKSKILTTNHVIDHMVYELYGLTTEEIRIVEDGFDGACKK